MKIDWNDFEWEEFDLDDPIKVGDDIIITNELYKKYPRWTDYFKEHLNKTKFQISEVIYNFVAYDNKKITVGLLSGGNAVPIDTDIIKRV